MLCVVLCVCLCQPLCVCVVVVGGAHMCMHASSLVVFMSVCVMDLPPCPTDLLLVFYEFYLSRVEQMVF